MRRKNIENQLALPELLVTHEGACSGSVTGTDTETVTNTVVPTPGAFAASTAGTYSFQAVYSGDANNNAATSTCKILTVTNPPTDPKHPQF